MSLPLSTTDILREEACRIHGEHALDDYEDARLAVGLNQLESRALCLSGGGVRSAVFSLGVIQALADHEDAEGDLLSRFHFLSTVSGGGFIGAWLTAWLSRQPYQRVRRQLTGRTARINAIEPTPIGDLRRDSNYLTPKVGLLSADTWAALSMVFRNMALNWIVLLPILLLAVIALKFLTIGVAWLPHSFGSQSTGLALLVLGGASLALVLLALRFTLKEQSLSGPASPTQNDYLRGNLIPLFLGGIAWTGMLHTVLAYRTLIVFSLGDLVVIGALAGLLVYAFAQLLTLLTTARLVTVALSPSNWSKLKDKRVWGWVLSGLVYGAVLAVGAHLLGAGSDTALRLVLLLVFGPPWLLLAQVTAETAYVALTSASPNSDEQREWFARAAGWCIAAGVFWIVVVGLALFGSLLVGKADEGFDRLIDWIAAAGGISAVIGVVTGASSKSSALGKYQSRFMSIAYDVAAKLSAPLFFLLLITLGSAVIDHLVLGKSLFAYLVSFDDYPLFEQGFAADWGQSKIAVSELPAGVRTLLTATVILAVIGYIGSTFVNINRFSLHGLYRNRLIRAFLGASHLGRKPDRFTGFDRDDNPDMAELWPDAGEIPRGVNWRPFHVLNMALNIVSTRNLAWQQRKALSFTVSPLHSGSGALSGLRDEPGGLVTAYRGAYRRSDEYGGSDLSRWRWNKRTDKDAEKSGISLGTAMAISGAAVNPSMGYHSSPTVSLLLTLFNVRLGWWLGNPGPAGEHSWRHNGPRHAAFPLIMDAFGLTTDRRPNVSLSDGGHFENLGLYEMVRRRCRCILVIDASCDPDFTYSDLGDSIRKIEIDFGVPIVFDDLQALKPRPSALGVTIEAPYHAVARIDYSAADGKDAPDGILVYVKASFHNDGESAGVKAYANANPAFPHEPTTDQWFTESQFESYRALGYDIMRHVLKTEHCFGKAGTEEPRSEAAHVVREDAVS
ncbi:patatin-like phospholipase family protein [Rhizobium sp. TRM95796]|uniref:patatin-like phospholipase family protein n=1 Tax=Rhizobium sp. TRM95796 TaxID=2979862 RepID=UPI0021E7A9FF|nr:patatin-like phospholipase family protein [Rhizobium sp. TRM95796]MCV3768603.1 patatin-like phospholipase family protein [Rhizobium sp. TRM95796]